MLNVTKLRFSVDEIDMNLKKICIMLAAQVLVLNNGFKK